MTRDEAMKIVYESGLCSTMAAETIVDSMAALGIIKLDEPKSPYDRVCEKLGWPSGGRSASEFAIALERANSKIVEK